MYFQEEFQLDVAQVTPESSRPRHTQQNGKKSHTHWPDIELPLGIDTTFFETWPEARWEDCRGYQTPTDESTGLPVPVLPVEPLYPNTNTDFYDYHHLFHPESDLIHGDDSDLALRRSYGQELPRWLHEHYHRFFAGPALPQSRTEKFVTVVLACSGVVPRQAIEFTKTGPVHRIGLTDNQYESVRETARHEGQHKGVTGQFYRNQIGIFFANYALEQNIAEAVNQSVIDEFLNTTRPDKRQALGNLMIREAIVLSLEPVKQVRQEAVRQGLATRNRKGLGSTVCEYFVLRRRNDYLDALRHRLELATA